jgi:hypothetical protein
LTGASKDERRAASVAKSAAAIARKLRFQRRVDDSVSRAGRFHLPFVIELPRSLT